MAANLFGEPEFDPEPAGARMWAVFSPCQRFRYTLGRRWGDGPMACFLMLNPSTADERQDDPTIRRCIGFAKRWGCGGLVVVNIFAFRSTDPRKLREHVEAEEGRRPGDAAGALLDAIVGPENDAAILDAAREASVVVAAWGAHGRLRWRDEAVVRLLNRHGVKLRALGVTKEGHPRHPLYVRGDTQHVPYPSPEG